MQKFGPFYLFLISEICKNILLYKFSEHKKNMPFRAKNFNLDFLEL